MLFHNHDENVGDSFCLSHCHNAYELYLLLDGNVNYVVGDKIYSLKPLHLLIIPPTVFHHPQTIEQGSYERIVFNFKPCDVNKDLRGLLTELNTHYSLKNHAFFRSVASELLPSFTQLPQEVFARSAKNLIELILAQLSTLPPETDSLCSANPVLSKIIEYIDENLDKKLLQEHIASLFYVTPTWINYAFKKHFGVCYSQYVKTKKMTYAHSLLQAGNPPKTASVSCGFDFYTTFLRQYKSFFGKLPGEDFVENGKI